MKIQAILTFVFPKPSPKRMISAMRLESGTTIAIGRNIDFKLSGNSVRPAYPVQTKINLICIK